MFLNWEAVTFGAGGFKTPPISFAPLPISKTLGLYYLSLILVMVLFALAQNLVRSRIGRAFVAVRDGEIAAESLGVDLLRYKALAFGISGFYAGIAGGLYSAMLNFVSPEGFDLFQMVIQKSMIIVGGLGSIVGSVLGAGALVFILEALRKVKGIQEIAFGAILVGFILFMPGGIIGFLKEKVRGWEEPLHRARTSRRPPIAATFGEQRGSTVTEALLSVRGVSVSFGGVRVLDSIDLDVKPGEIRGLIGPNGAGKTTMLNVICGIHPPHQGDVLLDGVSIVGRKPSAIARLGLGRTFQTSQLFRGMTVLENLMTGLHHRTAAGFIAASLNLRSYRGGGGGRRGSRPPGPRIHRHVGVRRSSGIGSFLRTAARHRDRPDLDRRPEGRSAGRASGRPQPQPAGRIRCPAPPHPR